MIEPYELAPEPEAPKLPGTVIVRETADAIIDFLGAELVGHAMECVRAFGDFHLALSGGSTPEPLYRRLMYDPPLRKLPWKRTHLWIVDERRVPEDDERSNFRMIRSYICEHSDIPAEQVHPMPATDANGDILYEKELREHLGWREKGHDRLDYVLLGMGDDAHTASLFPNSPALDAGERLVVGNDGPNVTPPARLTMTYRLINASRFIAVLVTGSRKRDTIARVEAAATGGGGMPRELPILGVDPVGGELRWYLDRDACSDPEAREQGGA
ncbi:MAG: 6-phosphogluconolactonase [Planctomycetota bacterium]